MRATCIPMYEATATNVPMANMVATTVTPNITPPQLSPGSFPVYET